MIIDKKVLQEIAKSINGCDEFIMVFHRKNPKTEEAESRIIRESSDACLTQMVINLFSEYPNLVQRIEDYSKRLMMEKIGESIEDIDVKPLTEEEIDTMYDEFISRGNSHERRKKCFIQ